MKKAVVLLMGLCIMVSFTACGDKANQTVTKEEIQTWSDEDFEKAFEELEESEREEKNEQEDKEEKKAQRDVTYQAKQEILDAEWYSGMVQFDDTIVQLPITLNELVDLGFDYEVYDKSKDYLFAEKETNSVMFYFNGVELFSVIVESDMEGFHTAEEINPCITEIAINGALMTDEAKTSVDIYFPGGIRVGDSYTVIEEQLGKPYEIDSNMTYHYGSSYSSLIGMSIYNSKETQEIVTIRVNKTQNLGDFQKLSEVTIEDLAFADINLDATVWFVPEYMEQDRGTIESVVLHEGKVYTLRLYAGVEPASYYMEPMEEKLFEETSEDGTYRIIADNYGDGYQYWVTKGDYTVNGIIEIRNISSSEEENLTEVFMEEVTEIVRSIEF